MNSVRVVRKNQVYFWSKRWQEPIKRSEEEIKKGNYEIYRSGKELKKDVEK